MKFTNIFNTYVETNNLDSFVDFKQLLIENISPDFLEEARSLNAELYKDLTIQDNDDQVTAEDVMNILFYEKGKNIKKDKSEEEVRKISEKQAQLFNEIIQKVKESSKNNKTTLVELTAAAVSVFRAAGQNSPTAGYNLRGVLSVLIGTKKILSPSDGGAVNAAAVTMGAPTPTGDIADTATELEEPVKQTSSKFDSALKDNEPSSSEKGKKYLKVNKESKIEKTDFESRLTRTDANFILNTLRNDLPGTLTKEDLLSRLKEEDSEINSGEMSSLIDELIKKGKIELTDKQESSADDSVPSQEENDEDSTSFNTDPEDFVDKQSLGATRKGFNVDFDF
jgi:hypothetical protein